MNYYHLGMTGDRGVNPGFPNFGDGRGELAATGVSSPHEYALARVGGVAGAYGGDARLLEHPSIGSKHRDSVPPRANANGDCYFDGAVAVGEAYLGAALYLFTASRCALTAPRRTGSS